ncbi:MAG TPA: FliM/FliN family flagellar motor C-terminal domain-containing protein [Acidobacteriaceae bacterium]|nr:FliM/FliN family flagellar motor C-terminal domain-containing protein [Terriglobia bacterium]HVC91226.1 FliM/FliN family flagellar motor C-terminal domain-containing protein [Acidobacteriaceae bacterium]
MEALQETIVSSGDAMEESVSPQESLSTAIPQRKSWPAVEWLPIQLSVALPVLRFCVRDLLSLDPGQIIATAWQHGDDLPLSIEDVQLAWVEVEAVDREIAVRITRLL